MIFSFTNKMCETENLIMSIEKYPCIWDINNTDYHNKDVKDLAWEQICRELFIDWETRTDKENKCAELKKKWTNIRDYYRREVQKTNNVSTGSAAKKAKKYIYSSLLYFLTPIFAKRDSEGNYPKEDTDYTQPQLHSENEEHNIELEDINHMEPTVPTSPVVNQKRKKDIPTQILNILEQRQKLNESSSKTPEDDNTKFLLSFRSHMNQMNHHQKIDFQLGMLQLVKKITVGENLSLSQYENSHNSSSSMPSPHVLSSYTPIPQCSLSHYNISSLSSSCTPSVKQNTCVPHNSPIYFSPSPSPSAPTFHSSSQQNNVPGTSISKPKIVIRTISKVTPPKLTTVENSEPTQLSILSEDSQEDMKKYLKLK